MSNHSGSYMLNSILFLLKNEYSFFKKINKEEQIKFISKIIKIGDDYDCNHGEIMEDLAKDLEFCYLCNESTQDFKQDYDICEKCQNEYSG